MKKILLAVLGRGCMKRHPGGPWAVTRDLDWWKLGEKRPDVLADQNDDDPDSVIGGGELQLAAALALYQTLDPYLAVFAYGNRSPYLKEQGYPSESSVMSRLFEDMLQGTEVEPRIDVFDEGKWNVQGSSSYQEIHNILTLAKFHAVDQVIFLTVLTHMSRVLVMAAKHLKDEPEFADLREKIRFEVTESVLLQFNAKEYAERVLKIFGSQSFLRNLERDLNGSKAMYKGKTQTEQRTPSAVPSK